MQAHVIRYTSLFCFPQPIGFWPFGFLAVSCTLPYLPCNVKRFFSWQCLHAVRHALFSCFTAKRGKRLLVSLKTSFRFRPFSWLCQKSFSLSRVFFTCSIFFELEGLGFFRPVLKNTLPKGFQLVKKIFSFFPLFLGVFSCAPPPLVEEG